MRSKGPPPRTGVGRLVASYRRQREGGREVSEFGTGLWENGTQLLVRAVKQSAECEGSCSSADCSMAHTALFYCSLSRTALTSLHKLLETSRDFSRAQNSEKVRKFSGFFWKYDNTDQKRESRFSPGLKLEGIYSPSPRRGWL